MRGTNTLTDKLHSEGQKTEGLLLRETHTHAQAQAHTLHSLSSTMPKLQLRPQLFKLTSSQSELPFLTPAIKPLLLSVISQLERNTQKTKKSCTNFSSICLY